MPNMLTAHVTREKPVEVPNSAPPEVMPLERAVEVIRTDSRQKPEVYLEETVVPGGGE